MAEAQSFKGLLLKRLPKNSGMVAELKCCVIMRVRRPSTTQASMEPMIAFPSPIQEEAMPYLEQLNKMFHMEIDFNNCKSFNDYIEQQNSENQI